MKKILLSPLFLTGIAAIAQQKDPTLTEIWQPEPRLVTAGKTAADPPEDAIVLFDGKSLAEWTGKDGKAPQWKVDNGIVTVQKGSGAITTKKTFGDCQLHIEWRTPAEVKGQGQGRGNSGIFLMGLYELQVLDSYKNRTYSNGQAASIYKQTAPLVNSSRGPGQWQTYDVIFTAPRFNKDSSLQSQARITVIHNGVVVQNNTAIWGATQFIGIATNTWHREKEPITLQDHGDAVSFRNIWIREL